MSLIFLLLLLLFVADVFDAFDCCWQQDSLIICNCGWLLNCLSDTPSNMVRNLSPWSWKSYNVWFAHRCFVAHTENSKLSLFLFYFLYRLPELPLKLLLHGGSGASLKFGKHTGSSAEGRWHGQKLWFPLPCKHTICRFNRGGRAASHTLHSSSQFHPETCNVWVIE